MKVIYPKTITDDVLISSNVDEPDTGEPGIFAADNNYSAGDRCFRFTTHKIYESLVDNNVGCVPEDNTTGTSPKWLEVGSTNKWKMFDKFINTQTIKNGVLEVVLDATRVTSVALIGVIGDSIQFDVFNSLGEVLKTKNFSLKKSECSSWYDYVYKEFTYHNRCFWSFIGQLTSGNTLKITVTPLSGKACIGTCVFGWEKTIGVTKVPLSLGINDFSIKEDDSFGQIYLEEGAYRDTCSFSIYISPKATDMIHQFLVSLRAKGCVWIVDNTDDTTTAMQSLVIFGFMKGFGTTVYSTGEGEDSECELQIESFV